MFRASGLPCCTSLFGPLQNLSLTLDGGLLLLKWTRTASPARKKSLLCFAHVLPKFTSLNCQLSREQENCKRQPHNRAPWADASPLMLHREPPWGKKHATNVVEKPNVMVGLCVKVLSQEGVKGCAQCFSIWPGKSEQCTWCWNSRIPLYSYLIVFGVCLNF